MRQGIVRGLAVCALAVVALAPVATAGAAGDGAVTGDGGPSGQTATGSSGSGPTWSDVVARAQKLDRVAEDATSGDALEPVAAGAVVAKTITVTPDTDLVSGQRVTVNGTGFAGAAVVIAQCGAGVANPLNCDLNAFDVVESAADGSVSTQFAVHRRVVASTGTIDCATSAGACVIGLASLPALSALDVTAPLAFDPSAPVPNPSITVTPSTGLLDGQQVTVAGSAFAPGSHLRIRQCSTVDPLCEGYPDAAIADASGAFSRTYAVRLRAFDAEGNATNCLAIACQVRVISAENSDYEAGASITFASGQPLPPTPHLTVTPSTGLLHHQSVLVAGSGFDANTFVDISECVDDEFASCNEQLGGAQTDAQGAFSQSVPVTRLVGSFGPAGFVAVDSASASCTIQAAGSFDETEHALTAEAPIGFDAAQPAPPLPAVTGVPTTDLPFAADVHVTGTGFTPGRSVYAQLSALSGPFPICRSYREAITDANGGLDLTFPVRRLLYNGPTTIDCAAADALSAIQVYGQFSYEQAAIPLTFDPTAPIPPQPTVVVTPGTGLTHLQTVDVVGSNFAPNAQIDISECGPSNYGYCADSLGFLQADSDGGFTASATVSRLLANSDFFGAAPVEIVDCAEVQCTVSVNAYGGDDDSIQVTAPIGFDGTVAPPARPVVTVEPSTDLPYRSTITVHGTGFGPGESVYATSCASASSFGFCDGSGFATAGADGTVSILMTARRVTGYAEQGFIDCVDPTSLCTVSVRGEHSYERTDVELGFDPDAPVPPPPAVSVVPADGLGYVQSVTVTGDGFEPGPVPISECTDTAFELLRVCAGYGLLEADASGHVAGTFDVRRLLKPGFGTPIDCLTAGCSLRVGNDYPTEHADIALGFDPNAVPPPPPTITVHPRTHLRHGQSVTVEGAHFAPGALVGLAPCKRGVTAIADDCDIAHAFAVQAGPDGTFTTTTHVFSAIGTSRGTVDCANPDGACILAAANAADLSEFAHRALSFDVPDVEAHSTTVTEGTGSDTEVEVMVDVSAPADADRTVAWNAVPGTADSSDYTPARGTVTIPAGATEGMIHVHVQGDAVDETTERFSVALQAPGLHVVGAGTVTIRDDDAAPTVTVRDARRREDHGEAHAEVLLSAPSGKTVIVHYVTHHLSARAGSDYVRKDSRLVFLPGETRHLVRVVLVDDRVHEATETFHVEIDRVEQARIARGIARVTITDDD